MRITQEHVGKTVRLNNRPSYGDRKVLAIHRNVFWAEALTCFMTEDCTWDWQLVEDPTPEKKPSERIMEIKFDPNNKLPRLSDSVDLGREVRILYLEFRAIIQYLDEQFAKRETK